ncbi:putative cytochrome-c oxidase (mitochondrion) [Helianthus annuus]|nr:putative cytochrome-c oxidase [Helianthus annuus]KAJ0427311.1 putative cytochrome-c oxidase [Helianthus annuus]KAJ0819031.1 putative cytochrome-c oxidase [Helianthus annuus]KAJ0959202.1 putative cytochrome-c oxidase [Helianthus annuus]
MKQVCGSSKLELAQLRLLEVDNRVVVPAKSHLRIAGPPPPTNNRYHHSRQS